MLSVVLPTYNEAQNLPEVTKRIAQALQGKEYEIVLVDDDSPDETWRIAGELAKAKHLPLRVIRRTTERGLSSAVTTGFAMAKGNMLLVMDSDLQHDPSVIVHLMEAIEGGADIAIASRYVDRGSTGEWSSWRLFLSRTATGLSCLIAGKSVSDPMSGFFALNAASYRAIEKRVRPIGFKILLEILSLLPSTTKIAEVPLQFGLRVHGQSKMSLKVSMQFLWHLIRIAARRIVQGIARWQRTLFWIVVGLIAIVLCLRVYPLLPLFTSASLRAQVPIVLREVAANEGWMISDMRLMAASEDLLKIEHRRHRRGDDPVSCFTIEVATSAVSPCAN